jgi:hypothetical protein
LLRHASFWRNCLLELVINALFTLGYATDSTRIRTQFDLKETFMQSHQQLKQSPRILAAMLMVAFVTGCGGGSSAPPTTVAPAASVSINVNNADSVGAQAYAASDSLNSSRASSTTLSNILTGVSVNVDSNPELKNSGLMTTILGLVYTTQNAPVSPNLLIGVTTNYEFSCANGGTLKGAVSKSAGSNIKSGDAFTLTATNCVNGNDTVNGSVAISFSNIEGTPLSTNAWSGTVATTFSNLSVKFGSAAAVTFTGDLSIGINQINAQNVGFDLSGSSLTSTNGVSSLSLSTFRFTGSQVGSAITYTTDFSLSGSNVSLGRFAIAVKTTTPVKFTLGSNPSQGVMVVTGANKSALKLTALNSSNVKVDVDQDGDGVFESTQTRTWATLLSKQ